MNNKNDNVNDLSIRDYFAAKAMEGLVSSASGSDVTNDCMANISFHQVAESAYQLADAMMQARKIK